MVDNNNDNNDNWVNLGGPFKKFVLDPPLFADYASDGGQIEDILSWWNLLIKHGPRFGYFPNPTKCVLLTKEPYLSKAKEIFANTGVIVTSEGKSVLGVPIGTDSFVQESIRIKVTKWTSDIINLAKIAETHPHAAYSAFGHGFSSRWTYFCRVLPLNVYDLQPMEDAIQNHLIPSITGIDSLSTLDREWINLPIRLGGLGLYYPCNFSSSQYKSSINLCSPLIDNLLNHSNNFSYEDQLIQRDLKFQNMKECEDHWLACSDEIFKKLPVERQRLMELAQEKGASSWLSTLPLVECGFSLNKSTFRDALCFRFGWTLSELPSVCVCGKGFSVKHALKCPMGGFQTRRHNEIRDLTADMLREVCLSVSVEPSLLPLRGEQFDNQSTSTDIGARLYIAVDNFWEAGRRTFFDVLVFNPLAITYQKKSLKSCNSSIGCFHNE
jgi:hypothetical protein